ncbi:putative Serine-threonine-protein [Naja naja]|nr:putative Serine-threonine-protein [Naja naja]
MKCFRCQFSHTIKSALLNISALMAAGGFDQADIISTVEFNHSGELLATGDKGGRVVIFQQEQENKLQSHSRGEYNVYSTFQSHEPEFDYLKSLEIEEKINKIRWLPQKNAAQFLLSTNDKTIKLWKISERDKRPEGYNLKEEDGRYRDPTTVTTLRPRKYGSVYVCTEVHLLPFFLYVKIDIVDIKPANMEELTEVITAAEFHPNSCNTFVYSSSKGTIRLCDMRASALCDRHSKLFEEPEDPSSRSFFSEIISSISDVKFSHSGRYMMTRDYLSVKIWDLNMENRPVETYQVRYMNTSEVNFVHSMKMTAFLTNLSAAGMGQIGNVVMTGSYNNFFRMFDRNTKRDITLEASRENNKPRTVLKPRKVCASGKRKKDEISVDSLDFNKKILHTAWHPKENIIAVATTNNLYIFQDKGI